MKALILCAGWGTRLMPLTCTNPKQLLPVANKPILYYLLEQVQRTGIIDAGIVVSPEACIQIQQAVGDGSEWDLSLTCIQQPQPLGLAHAVKVSRDFLGDDDFLMLLGDNLIQDDADQLMDRFQNQRAAALISLKEVDDCRQFGVAEVDKNGCVKYLVEKPREPVSKLAVAGLYVFSSQIHKAIDAIKPSARGELEITDAIQQLIIDGYRVISHTLTGWWFDIGTPEGLLQANRKMLDTCLESSVVCNVGDDNYIEGQVNIQPGSEVNGSTVRGPVSIGRDCRITKSVVGPYVSLGDGVSVTGSTIEDSIIMDGSYITGVGVIRHSIIGKNAKVKTVKSKDATGLCIGDEEAVEL